MLLGREVVLGRAVVGRDVVGRLVIPGRMLEGRLVPVELGREVVGRVTGLEVDGRLVGRVVDGGGGGGGVLGRDCGLEVGRDGRLVGRDGRLVGRLVGRLWGRDGRLVWPLVRWAAAASGALPAVAEGAGEAGEATAGPPSRASARSPAVRGVRLSRRERRGLVRSVMRRSAMGSRVPDDTKWRAVPGLATHWRTNPSQQARRPFRRLPGAIQEPARGWPSSPEDAPVASA